MIGMVKMPNFVAMRGTVIGWEVADQERGIWTTPDGGQVAWFKDFDGDVLSVSQHLQAGLTPSIRGVAVMG